MNLPTAEQFCKGFSQGGDACKCTIEWYYFLTEASVTETLRFIDLWRQHADALGIPSVDAYARTYHDVTRRNDHPDTTFAQLAECFGRTVREMETGP